MLQTIIGDAFGTKEIRSS